MADVQDSSAHKEPEGTVERITPEAILQPVAGPGGEVKLELTPTQRAGLRLLLWVGLAIAVATSVVLVDWYFQAPRMPALPADSQAAKAVLDNYKTLSDLAAERATKLFDLIVVKAFLPTFTAILGYVFGTRSAGQSE